MTALPRPGYTLGVFDGDILEERIRRLMERPAANLKRARLLLAGGPAALALCAVFASTLALTARAQGAARATYEAGRGGIQSRRLQKAASEFENAVVRLEPDNVKAKLLLADSLVQQYGPGTDPANPVAGARQQYLRSTGAGSGKQAGASWNDDARTNSKQFAEAHEWALKAIQADPTDASAYYTAGFMDWAMTYPDYMAARQAAGMKPQDPGPAATLRPLLGAALDNALAQGDAALTGPIVRGDVNTVRAHLRDITENAPATVPSYVAMAKATADRAVLDGRLLPIRAARIVSLLDEALVRVGEVPGRTQRSAR